MAAERPGASSEDPIPVRTAARLVRQWIDRLGVVWVEGQVSQIRSRQSTVWITLRDPDTDLSIPLMASAGTARSAGLAEGQRVVAQLKVNYFDRNGSLTWRASAFRAVGVGALMQQLEQLKQTLAKEGLFREEHKRPLPMVPVRIGLICGTNSAAQRDVEVNARHQWPTARFEVREVTVQGAAAVASVVTALVDLDGHPEVDVIVITRGGGSFEDLLPFSNETLIRAVFDARTPVVSAIGHEEDSPLLDLVADIRASTPTAAGKLVVPDLLAETGYVADSLSRIRTLAVDRLARERLIVGNLVARPVMTGPTRLLAEQAHRIRDQRTRLRRLTVAAARRERRALDDLVARPALRLPGTLLAGRRRDRDDLRSRLRRAISSDLTRHRQGWLSDRGRLTALSPQATLDRGYAIVRDTEGSVVRAADEVSPGAEFEVRVARGSFRVTAARADSRPAPVAVPEEET